MVHRQEMGRPGRQRRIVHRRTKEDYCRPVLFTIVFCRMPSNPLICDIGLWKQSKAAKTMASVADISSGCSTRINSQTKCIDPKGSCSLNSSSIACFSTLAMQVVASTHCLIMLNLHYSKRPDLVEEGSDPGGFVPYSIATFLTDKPKP